MIIREKDRLAILKILQESPLLFEVWAFGSRVRGDAHEASDLDLVIRTPDLQKFPAQELSLLRDKIQDSNIPILIQLHDWARIPPSFHTQILEQYEVLFTKNSVEESHA